MAGIRERKGGIAIATEDKPITIKGISVEPATIPEAGSATIRIDARSMRGWPLEFEVRASEGTIEPTEEPNVFLWHGPKSARRPSALRQRSRFGVKVRRR